VSLENILLSLGMKTPDIDSFLQNPHSLSNEDTLKKHIDQIKEVYGWEDSVIGSAILKCPQFAGYNHERVVAEANAVYQNEDKVKAAILKCPSFAGLNHSRVVAEANEVYQNEDKVKAAILKFPSFAGLNHSRVIAEANEVYQDERRVKAAILKFPSFASLNHSRVIAEANEVYQDERRVKAAILKFPSFASLNHSRVVRQKTRFGRIVGLSNQQTINIILERPVFAGYSAKRYLAGLDIARTLKNEGIPMDERMLGAYMTYISKSPYVPGTRLRISKFTGGEEPPLMTVLRKRLH